MHRTIFLHSADVTSTILASDKVILVRAIYANLQRGACINKFTNINWAAFLWGGVFWALWNRFYGLAIGSLVALFVAGSIGSSFGEAGIALSSMVQWLIPHALALYLALNGNRMLAERIERKDLSLKGKENAKFWVHQSQKRQAVAGIICIVGFCTAAIALANLWTFAGVVASSLLPAIVTFLIALVVLLIFALIFHSGKNELLQSSELESVTEPTPEPLTFAIRASRRLRDNRTKVPWIFAGIMLTLLLAGIAVPLVLEERGVTFAPLTRQGLIEARQDEILATDIDPSTLSAIAGQYRATVEYVSSSGTHFRRPSAMVSHYAINSDRTFIFSLQSGGTFRGVFSAEEIAFSDIADIVDSDNAVSCMKFIEDRIGANWYHLALFGDELFQPEGDLFISIVGDDVIFYLFSFQTATVPVERIR